jgi:hypothetical protein
MHGQSPVPWIRDGIREQVLSQAELPKLCFASAHLDRAALCLDSPGLLDSLSIWRTHDIDDCGTERGDSC